MPARKTIVHTVGTDLYSVQVYPPSYFETFEPHTVFEKWATMEVAQKFTIPPGMELLMLPQGQYAVFFRKGSDTNTETFEYIFIDWLPQSDYLLDTRPHFEVLGEKYKNGDPDSEEEIWIPVRLKKEDPLTL